MFKTKGWGVKGFLNNVQKTADLVEGGTPYCLTISFSLSNPTFNHLYAKVQTIECFFWTSHFLE